MTQFENSEIMVKFAEIMLKEAAPPTAGRIHNVTEPLEQVSINRIRSGNYNDLKNVAEDPNLSHSVGNEAADIIKSAAMWIAADAGIRKAWRTGAKMISSRSSKQAGQAIVKYGYRFAPKALGVAVESGASSAIGGGAAAAAGTGGGTALLGLSAPAIIGGAAVLAVGTAIGYGIWRHMDQTRADIDNVLGHLKALDYEGTEHVETINQWRQQLTKAKIGLTIPAKTGNPVEDAINLGAARIAFENAKKVLSNITPVFEQIKGELNDWGTDKEDFENSVKRALTKYETRHDEVRKQSLAASNEVYRTMEHPPSEALKIIANLENKIASLWGKPEYSQNEIQVINVLKNVNAGKADLAEYEEYKMEIIGIISQLTNLLPAAQQLNRTKLSSMSHPISKRAVTLPNQPDPNVGKIKQTQPSNQISQRQSIPRNDVVAEMQKYINHIKVYYGLSINNLSEDGMYGSETGKALGVALSAIASNLDQDTLEYFKRQGADISRINDIQFMNNNPGLINIITNKLEQVVQVIKSGPDAIKRMQQGQPAQVQQTPYGAGSESVCNWKKQKPTKQEMLQCFKQLSGTIGGTNTNLYDYARENLGLDDNDIFDLLYGQYPGWAPMAWSKPQIIDLLGKRYSILR